MDDEARKRLKAAIAQSEKTAQGISESFGWPKTYVSRVASGGKGGINSPDPTRLLQICDTLGVDIAYILTGRQTTADKQKLLSDIAQSPQHVIDQVADFVREIGLEKK